MRFAFLRMVTAENNHNKVYIMKQTSSNEFIAEYGREGASLQKKVYNLSNWDRIYDQKIRKGYDDITKYHQSSLTSNVNEEYKTIDDPIVEKLVNDILYYSNKVIKKEYNVSYEAVTQQMIDDAETILQDLINRFYGKNTIDDAFELSYIQSQLIQLWKIIPRRMSNVAESLYQPKCDFQKYITKEADILDVMRGRVNSDVKKSSSSQKDKETILEAYGLSIEPIVKESSLKRIKGHLDPYTADRFYDAFRLHNKKYEDRFYSFMNSHGYTDKDVHWLYHGSRNQNIFGLLTKSYLINSGAIRTGSMYGNGIYTASLGRKSLGYTSLSESCWNKESSKYGFIFLNKVLYNNPKDIYVWTHECSRFNRNRIQPYDAVFAHKGQSIKNDEFVVFDERQILQHTLIRLKSA